MASENKQLLLKDLCGRLPYGVKVHITDEWFYGKIESYDRRLDCDVIRHVRENRHTVKPYLRPLSSMTEEEKEEYNDIIKHLTSNIDDAVLIGIWGCKINDFYNKHHLDYRGLIPMGLALEASKDMYKIN